MNRMAKRLDDCHGRFIRCFFTAEQAFRAGNLEPLAGERKSRELLLMFVTMTVRRTPFHSPKQWC